MISGPDPVPIEVSIFSAKLLFGMISYSTSMSGLAAMNASTAALFWSTIGGCVWVQNLILVLSWARAGAAIRVAAPSATGAAANPWAKRRRERRPFAA